MTSLDGCVELTCGNSSHAALVAPMLMEANAANANTSWRPPHLTVSTAAAVDPDAGELRLFYER